MRKQKIEFIPFSKDDVNVILSDHQTAYLVRIAYRVTKWFDTRCDKLLFGIEAKNEIGEWHNMCMDSRALVFSDKSLAYAVCRLFKKRLNNIQR